MNSKIGLLTPKNIHPIYKCLSSRNHFCNSTDAVFFFCLNMITGNTPASQSGKRNKFKNLTVLPKI